MSSRAQQKSPIRKRARLTINVLRVLQASRKIFHESGPRTGDAPWYAEKGGGAVAEELLVAQVCVCVCVCVCVRACLSLCPCVCVTLSLFPLNPKP